MQTKKVVLFNAPPEAGKDVAAEVCAVEFGMDHKEFKAKLYDIVQCIHSLTDAQLEELKKRENKEVPTNLLDGLSLREALIKASEEAIKPNYGYSYFGKALSKSIVTHTAVSDSGFVPELMEVVKAVGEENVLLVRIHREGCDFSGDSREYIPNGVIKNVIDITNPMPKTDNEAEFQEYKQIVRDTVSAWISE